MDKTHRTQLTIGVIFVILGVAGNAIEVISTPDWIIRVNANGTAINCTNSNPCTGLNGNLLFAYLIILVVGMILIFYGLGIKRPNWGISTPQNYGPKELDRLLSIRGAVRR